jgi:signal transduction histidine kinase
VAGDRPLLERLVANLVENGIRYNHEGGWVEVAVFPADDEVVTRVSNTGDAVAPDEVDSLFEPFRRRGAGRAKDRRHGVGLGLSIVRSVASAHRGRVTARARTEGGLEVVVRLPGVVSDG